MDRTNQFCTTCKRTCDSGCEDCKYFVPEIEVETVDYVKYMDDEKAKMLIEKCSKHPEIYNKVSNLIYKDFELQGAELALLCTYCVLAMTEKEGDES